jgi:hypothetical protein
LPLGVCLISIVETIDINICPEDGSQNRENLKVLNIDGPNDELGSRMNDTVSDEKSVKFNSRIETENPSLSSASLLKSGRTPESISL